MTIVIPWWGMIWEHWATIMMNTIRVLLDRSIYIYHSIYLSIDRSIDRSFEPTYWQNEVKRVVDKSVAFAWTVVDACMIRNWYRRFKNVSWLDTMSSSILSSFCGCSYHKKHDKRSQDHRYHIFQYPHIYSRVRRTHTYIYIYILIDIRSTDPLSICFFRRTWSTRRSSRRSFKKCCCFCFGSLSWRFTFSDHARSKSSRSSMYLFASLRSNSFSRFSCDI